MTTLPQLHAAAQQALETAAQAAERATGFVIRQSKLTGPLFVKILVLGWLANPHASLEELAQVGAQLALPITAQGIDARFSERAAWFLREVLSESTRQRITGLPAAIPLLERFTAVYVMDGSIVTLPAALASLFPGHGGGRPKPDAVASGGSRKQGADPDAASMKLSVRWNLKDGELSGPELTAGRVHDRNADLVASPLPVGSLRIADLGYWCLNELARLGRMGGYFLSRLKSSTGFYDESGRAWKLGAFLLAHEPARSGIDVPIALGFDHCIAGRLVARRVPEAVASERRRQLRATARKGGRTPTAEALALCDWNVFVTNVPPEKLTLDEVFVLGRLRWQIELLFKLWKSELSIDDWRSQKEWRILCEVYAKLLGALLSHWILVVCGGQAPDRSLVKATQTIRRWILPLGLALGDLDAVLQILARIQRGLDWGCRLNKRKKRPSSAQLALQSPSLALA